MATSDSARNAVEMLAEEFLARRRRGESPTLSEYASKYPHLADEIRGVFPALRLLEEADPTGADLTSTPQSVVSPPPAEIGDYRILREVGRGGMGLVYEAEQQSLGRRVALKVLPPHIARDPVALERFRREAKAAAKLHHSNIVPVFEVGQEGDSCFYAMQFIQGLGLDLVIRQLRRLDADSSATKGAGSASETRADTDGAMNQAVSLLSGRFRLDDEGDDQHVDRGDDHSPTDVTIVDENFLDGDATSVGQSPVFAPLASESSIASLPGQDEASTVEPRRRRYYESVAHIGRQTADALAYAHARGVVHRDVKPSNLLLDSAGVVWVTDFGLAKMDDDGLTRTGDILGTMRYMSPERFRGECDARADVYGLGVTLYELLALRPAFKSSDRMTLVEQITSVDPPRLREIDRRIPRDLETIVLKSIDKDAHRRYPSAAAMAEDLQRFIDDEPIRARRATPPERLVRWARRNRAIAASLTAIAVLLLTVAGVSAYWALEYQEIAGSEANQRERADQAHKQTKLALDAANVARREVDAAAAKIEDQLGKTRIAREQAEANLYASLVAQANQSLQGNDVAGAERLLDKCIPEPGATDRRGWEWYFLKGYARGNLYTLAAPSTRFTSTAFSPDGKLLAAGATSGEIKIFDGFSGEPIRTIGGARIAAAGDDPGDRQSHVGAVRHLAFSPAGDILATAGDDRTILLWNTSTWEVVGSLFGPAPARRLAFHPSKPQLTAIFSQASSNLNSPEGLGVNGALIVYSLDPPGRLFQVNRAFARMAYSPDGSILALVDHDGRLLLCNSEIGARITTPLPLPSHATDVALFSDPPRGASSHGDGTLRIWDVKTGALLDVMRGHRGAATAVAATPRCIATAGSDQTVRVWRPSSNMHGAVYRGHTLTVSDVVFSDDLTRLASVSSDAVKTWDLSRDPETMTLRPPSGDLLRDFAFVGDAARLVTFNASSLLTTWDAAQGQAVSSRSFMSAPPDGLPAASRSWSALSGDGRVLATSSSTGEMSIVLRDSSAGLVRATIDLDPEGVRHLAIDEHGDRVVTYSSDDAGLNVWNGSTGRLEVRVPLDGLTERERRRIDASTFEEQLAEHPDDPQLLDALAWRILFDAEGANDYLPRAVDMANQAVKLDDGDGRFWVTLGAALYRTGDFKAAITALRQADELQAIDGAGRFFLAMAEAKTGAMEDALPEHTRAVNWFRENQKDDGRLAQLERESAALLGLAAPDDGEPENQDYDTTGMSDDSMVVRCVALSRDGRYLAVGHGRPAVVRIWDLKKGVQIALAGESFGNVDDVAFNSDGRRLATITTYGLNLNDSSEDCAVRVYDVADGRRRLSVAGPRDLSAICFSPDDRRLAAVGASGGVRFWDAATGRDVLALGRAGASGSLRAYRARVKFDSAGRRLAVNNADGAVQIWEARPAATADEFARAAYYQSLLVQFRRAQINAVLPPGFSREIDAERLGGSIQIASALIERARAYARVDQWSKATADLGDAADLLPQDEQLRAELQFARTMNEKIVLVRPIESWRWFHPTDGVDPAIADPDFNETFPRPDFDDAKWKVDADSIGPGGGFGYGDDARVVFERPTAMHRKTAYFRHRFTTNAAHDRLILSLQRDDGVIVYLDGREVLRNNVDGERDEYDLLASDTVSGEDEIRVNRFQLTGVVLEPGEHVIAISLHNREGASTDLRLAEISLRGSVYQPRPPEPTENDAP